MMNDPIPEPSDYLDAVNDHKISNKDASYRQIFADSKKWFSCFFWNMESQKQHMILSENKHLFQTFNERFFYIALPEILGVRMSEILKESIHENSQKPLKDVVIECIDTYVSRVIKEIPEGPVREFYSSRMDDLKDLYSGQHHIDHVSKSTMKGIFFCHVDFIKMYEFLGSHEKIDYRSFCAKDRTRLKSLILNFQVSMNTDYGDKFLDSTKFDSNEFFDSESKRFIYSMSVDQFRYVVKLIAESPKGSVSISSAIESYLEGKAKNERIDKPDSVTYLQINELFTQILVESYSNNSMGCTPYMLASVNYVNSVIADIMYADFLERYDVCSSSPDATKFYAILELILPLVKQHKISYNAVLSLIFAIDRPNAFASSSTWAYPNDIIDLVEKCVVYSRQNNYNEQDALSNVLGVIERVVLVLDEQIKLPSAKKWQDNIDVIATIDPEISLSMIPFPKSKRTNIPKYLKQFREMMGY